VLLPPDIGLPCDIWEHLPLGAALERVAAYAELSEIYSGDGHALLSAENRRAARESGLRLTVHGPWEDLEPAATSERRRRRSVAEHRRHLEAAAEIGAVRYVVHPDYDEGRRKRDARSLAALERTLEDLAGLQAELGVPVVVENMPGSGTSHFNAPGDLDLGALGFVLDTGHAAITGVLHDFLFASQARLQHVHLHDNRGPADAADPHGTLGTGVVDARLVLAAARAAQATVILELLDERSVRDSIAHLQARGLIPGE
jgi:sugar phosphate isomerase/epimerase